MCIADPTEITRSAEDLEVDRRGNKKKRRKIIMRDFWIEEPSRLETTEKTSWRSEYQRLVDNTPEICTEVHLIYAV